MSLPGDDPVFVANLDLLFAFELHAQKIEFKAKRGLVDPFSEPRPQLSMDSERTIHHEREDSLFALIQRRFDPKHCDRPI